MIVLKGIGAESLSGTAADDQILAGVGNDLIQGREGSDFILAGSGNDTVFGDNYIVDGRFGGPLPPPYGGNPLPGDNLIFAGAGNDQIIAGFGSDTVFGGAGNDLIRGYGAFGGSPSGVQAVTDADGADWLYGGAGQDSIDGGGGRDHLFGDAGNDQLVGGTGTDTMSGGAGADLFIFGRGAPIPVPDTGVGAEARDVILDFQEDQDHISLVRYANFFAGPGGQPPPVFLGEAAFTASFALQVRAVIEGGHTLVQFAAPFGQPPEGTPPTVPDAPTGEIELAGVHHLTAADFILA